MDLIFKKSSSIRERESLLFNLPAELLNHDKEKGTSSTQLFANDEPGDFLSLYRKKGSLDFYEPSLPRFPNVGPFIRKDIPDPSKNNVPIKKLGKNLDDAFLGYSMSNSKVCCVSRDKIIFRKDYESMTKKVRIVSSGVGFWGDFVGTGMLTCMILGTHGSPKPRVIYTALKELNMAADQGILAIVPNNYDDKLNWGLAIARAQRKGVEMDCFNFGDNANEDQEIDGRTCLPGIVISYKLAGAMSEEKRSLKSILNRLRLMFFSSISCHFGATSAVRLGTDLDGTGGREMKGASRSDVMQEVVSCLLDPEREYSVGHDPGAEFVLFVNTYVAHWPLTQVVTIEMLQRISNKGFKCSRVYSGNLVSSASHGFSVTILPEACSNTLRWLDNYTTCLGWLAAGTGEIYKYQIDTRPSFQESKGIYFDNAQAVLMRRVIDLAASRFRAAEDYLNSNDHCNMFGTNMCKVIDSLIKDSDSKKSFMQYPHYIFTELATSFLDIFNNKDGIMFALFCTTMGQYFAQHSRPSKRINERVWQRALQKSVKSLAGYFKIGHKDNTLLDIFGSLYMIIASSGLDTVTDLHLALEVGEKQCWKAKYAKSKGIIDCPQAMMKASCIILDAIATGLRERLGVSVEDIDTAPNTYVEKIKEVLLYEDK